jgi:poly-gamma-glutamate capsule biosynthesis protein CapA/YwtB (metallophosphatase superfamily)
MSKKEPEYVETFPDGTVIERPWTPEELAQQRKDRDDYAAARAAAESAAATAAKNAADAIAHAKSLGFTDAMITAMYPALVVP